MTKTKLPTKKEVQEIATLFNTVEELAKSPLKTAEALGIELSHPAKLYRSERKRLLMAALDTKYGFTKLGGGSFRDVFVTPKFPELVFKVGSEWCNAAEYRVYKGASRKDKLRFARVFALSEDETVVVQRKIEGMMVVDTVDHLTREAYRNLRQRMMDEFSGFCDAHDENVMYVPEKDKLILVDLGHE